MSSSGALEWQRTLGGSAEDDAFSIQQTEDGGYIVAGSSSSIDGDVSGNLGEQDFWIIKLNNTGIIDWQKSFGGSGEDTAHSIRQTSDGGYIVAGHTSSYDGDISWMNGNFDYWVVKLSNAGNLEWEKALGGVNGDIAREIQQTSDGGYIVVGFSGSNNSGDVTGHHSLLDYWIVKLSVSGDIQWQKSLGGTGLDYGESIIQTANGGYVVFGSTDSIDGDLPDTDGGTDFWLVGLSELGNIQWQKRLGGTKADEGYAVRQTSDNGFILAGSAWSNDGDLSGQTIHGYNDFWIVKLSPETSSSTHAPLTPLSIFPNPAQTTITLQIPTTESTLHVSISDLLGRTLSQQTITNGSEVDIARLPSGQYMVSASTEAGQVYLGKLRKE